MGTALAGVNALTTPAFCPRSKQPELKHAAVKVLKAEPPWRLLGVAWLANDQALSVRDALQPLMREFDFASCVPFGRERSGVVFRAAAHDAVAPDLIARIEALLGLDGSAVLHYADKRRGQRRSMRLVSHGGDTRFEGFLLAGDISAEAWIRPLLQDELPAQAYGRLLLVPGAKAPVAVAGKGRQVCSCFNVGESAIDGVLASCEGSADSRLQQLQARLQCGTNCGSCLPS